MLRTKNYEKIYCILVIFILLGCRSDVTETFNENQRLEKKKYFIKRNEIANQSVIKKLDAIQNKSLNSLSKNSGDNLLGGRIILDHRIFVAEDENQQKAYTFPVRNIKDSTSALENLVIIPNKDSYSAFIIRYNVDKEERKKLVQDKIVEDIFTKIEVIDVDYNKINFPQKQLTNLQNRGVTRESTRHSFGCVTLIVTETFYSCCESSVEWEVDTSSCYGFGDDGGGGGGNGGGGGEDGSGGGGSSGGGTTPIEEDAPGFAEEYENTVANFRNKLNGSQYTWFTDLDNKYIGMDLAVFYNQYNTPQVFNFLASLIDKVLDNPSNLWFPYEVMNFLNINPDISWEQFNRIFFTPKVLNDGGDDFDFSKYQNQQTQKLLLPKFTIVNQNYPRDPNNNIYGMPSDQVYKLVGGNMYSQNLAGNPNYANACAIRISRVLNYSGQPIPIFYNDEGKQKSEKGSDGKNYILSAEAMLAYMLKTYPTPILYLYRK